MFRKSPLRGDLEKADQISYWAVFPRGKFHQITHQFLGTAGGKMVAGNTIRLTQLEYEYQKKGTFHYFFRPLWVVLCDSSVIFGYGFRRRYRAKKTRKIHGAVKYRAWCRTSFAKGHCKTKLELKCFTLPERVQNSIFRAQNRLRTKRRHWLQINGRPNMRI